MVEESLTLCHSPSGGCFPFLVFENWDLVIPAVCADTFANNAGYGMSGPFSSSGLSAGILAAPHLSISVS